MSEKIFELENVEFAYLGKILGLNKVSLAINKGENVILLGANGSGKSTLLHLLAGLIIPSKGKISAFGRALDNHVFNDNTFRSFFRSKVAILFQNSDVQLFSPTVEEELYFGPQQLGLPQEKTKKISLNYVPYLV